MKRQDFRNIILQRLKTSRIYKLAINSNKNAKSQKQTKSLKSPRELSLMSKAIILNTLILAKTAYLSNIFPIPQDILI